MDPPTTQSLISRVFLTILEILLTMVTYMRSIMPPPLQTPVVMVPVALLSDSTGVSHSLLVPFTDSPISGQFVRALDADVFIEIHRTNPYSSVAYKDFGHGRSQLFQCFVCLIPMLWQASWTISQSRAQIKSGPPINRSSIEGSES